MNEYIIYTTEGHTIAPNEGVEIENCQVLGCLMCKQGNDVVEQLLKENPWIVKAGFNPEKFIVKQIIA